MTRLARSNTFGIIFYITTLRAPFSLEEISSGASVSKKASCLPEPNGIFGVIDTGLGAVGVWENSVNCVENAHCGGMLISGTVSRFRGCSITYRSLTV